MVKINPVKTFECAGKYKNGGHFNLRIKSSSPRKYELDCVSFSNEGKPIGAYGEHFGDGCVEKFAELSKNFIDKVKRNSEDNEVINKITEFFTSISK